MSDLIKRINQREIFVTIHPSHNGQLSRELVNLARKGDLYQRQLDECADEMRKFHSAGWTCCDDSCRGHRHCKAYKAEVIE